MKSTIRERRLPDWLSVRLDRGENYTRVRGLLRKHRLNTVCQGARCPNQWECWNQGTATFMILGGLCTRGCTFCGVPPDAGPGAVDPGEALAVARAVAELELDWTVITSVTRDDLPDGGAGHFAACVAETRRLSPECGVELLIPDFGGDTDSLRTVAESGAVVIGHNVETVPRLYGRVRPQADYNRSLDVLCRLVRLGEGRYSVKSSLMVGLGESEDEIGEVLDDLAATGCDTLTLGQYLRPSKNHLKVERYYTPGEFDRLAETARSRGIAKVASGPKVRSSYMAHQLQGRSLRSEDK
ncbi:MAG: lipoyl synthase [Candidatus Glassbacteria bacterium]|nr:lipoyl synthase [Candidatus Glassbacteria bacterium]